MQYLLFFLVMLGLLASCSDNGGGAGKNNNNRGPTPFVCESRGTTYTVSQDGSGDFQTVQDCVDQVGPGETCLVAPGAYPERVNVSGLRGTETECITVRGEPGAVMDGEGTRRSLFYSYDGGHWFIIEGFDIRGSNQDGAIFLGNVHHVIIRNNVIHDTYGSAEGFFCSGGCVQVLIENNEVYNVTGKEGIYFARPRNSSPPSHDIIIRNNHLHDISNEGVDLKNTYAALIDGNVFERTGALHEFGLGISLTTGTYAVEIRDNTFKDMGMGQGRAERGAAILTGDSDPSVHHVHIHHNLIFGGDFAGIFLRGGPGHVVEQNTIVGVGLSGIDLACFQAGCGGSVIRNNLVADCGGVEIGVGAGSDGMPDQSDYNLAYDTSGGPVFYGYATADEACTERGFECHSIVKQPWFVDPASGDYRLLPGSPGCGQGEGDADIGALSCL